MPNCYIEQGSPDLKAAKEVADYLGTVHHEFHFTVQVFLHQKAVLKITQGNLHDIKVVLNHMYTAYAGWYRCH